MAALSFFVTNMAVALSSRSQEAASLQSTPTNQFGKIWREMIAAGREPQPFGPLMLAVATIRPAAAPSLFGHRQVIDAIAIHVFDDLPGGALHKNDRHDKSHTPWQRPNNRKQKG